MSFKKNTIANYIGQLYISLIGIIILPFYLKYLGATAFGLIGLFAVMQSWFKLLDMGLSPAFTRQVAYECGKGRDLHKLTELLRSLEIIFFIFSILIVVSITLGSRWIAHSWLRIGMLPASEVINCVILMGLMIGLRWFSDLYQNGIRGMEKQVWLNGANIVMISMQYIGGWAFLHWVSDNPVDFFEYQLLICILSLFLYGYRFYMLLPVSTHTGLHFSWISIKEILPFAGATAYLAVVWIALTQLDKLLLSHILPLTQYGYFALVTVISNGMLVLMGPINQAILPRMTHLFSQGKEKEMLKLYCQATQVMAVIMFSLTAIISIFSTELLYAWTGNQSAATWGGPILFWYTLGNGFLSVLTFQYYLQYAHGKLKLNVWINTISAIITIPIIFFAAYNYGALGTALTWFGLKAISFFIWPPIVHHRYAPGLHLKWLLKDIAPMLIMTGFLMTCLQHAHIPFYLMNRAEIATSLLGLGLIVLIINMFCSSICRHMIMTYVKKI